MMFKLWAFAAAASTAAGLQIFKGACTANFPYVYRPGAGYDYCCATTADNNGNSLINGLQPKTLRADNCKGSQYQACANPPCQDYNFAPNCGAEISPLNANDFSSKAAMEAAGWTVSVGAFKHTDYASYLAVGYDASNAFWGHTGGTAVGSVEFTMQVTGNVELSFGRNYNRGHVRLYLNGVEIKRTTLAIKTVKFEVAAGDTIKLSEHDTTVMAIYHMQVCSTTPAPTASPTGAPTASPTGAPTTAEAFALETLLAGLNSSPWQTGQIGDTVYKCFDRCFENAPADRTAWTVVDKTPAIEAALDDHAVHTMSDGSRFDMGLEGITFTDVDGGSHFFPWECTCA